MPRVSVILPNYNYARYLKERVRSILNQTYRDFELIYVDDASTDESNAVMQEFASDPRVRIRLYEQNSGRVYQRWNDGAEMATGEWLWFAGADDSAHPRFLERLLTRTAEAPNAALASVRCPGIDAEGRLLALEYRAIPSLTARLASDYVGSSFDEVVRLTEGCFLFTASAVLLRHDVFRAAEGFDTRLWLTADWDLYLTMLRDHDLVYTAEPLAYYRTHRRTVSKTTRAGAQALENAYCVARACAWLREDPRCTPEIAAMVTRRVRACLFDLFADPSVAFPEQLYFAAAEVYRVVPDRRLLR